MEYILTLDVGTSSMRGIIYDTLGSPYYTKQLPYSPLYKKDQWVEVSPAIFTSALFLIMNACNDYAYEHKISFSGISITSQRSSFLPVNSSGVPLQNIMMWQDQRANETCSQLDSYGELIYEKTGLPLSHIPFAPKIRWFMKHQASIDHKTYKYLTIVDYLIFIMTGKFVTDYTYGSRTLLMDLDTKSWNQDLLDIFEIKKDKLCSLIPQGSIVGSTNERFNKLSGLRESISIISAGGDQQCSTLGAFCLQHGDTLVTVGTGTYITTTSDKKVLTPSHLICGISAIPEKYHLEASVLAGSTTYNWYHRTFYPDDIDYKKINQEVSLSTPGSNGITCLPHLTGKGSPDWNPNASGLFYGIHPSSTRGDFARSILEGINFEVKENLDLMEDLSHVKSAGGLTNIDGFYQMQADIYGIPVENLSNKETTSLGAFISACVALHIYDSFESAVDILSKNAVHATYIPDEKLHLLYEKIRKNR